MRNLVFEFFLVHPEGKPMTCASGALYTPTPTSIRILLHIHRLYLKSEMQALLRNGRGVRDHAAGAHHLGQVSTSGFERGFFVLRGIGVYKASTHVFLEPTFYRLHFQWPPFMRTNSALGLSKCAHLNS